MQRFVMCAAVALVGAQAAQANLLVNPGFETGTAPGNGDVYGAAGWTSFGNVFNVSAGNPTPVGPHSGTGALKEFGTFPGVSGSFQSFTASAGQAWSLSGYILNASSDPMQADNFALLKISFQDASNNELLGIDSAHITAATAVDQWLFVTANGVAPAGTAHVNLFTLFVQPNFAGGSASFDDLDGSQVPAPASVALLGLGGLVASRRRR
jgi:hypothetical protein